MDKLAYAVAMAETGNCTQGIGPKTNNCFGITNGGLKNGFISYSSPSESYAHFKKIWAKNYGGFPTTAKASMWTGNKDPSIWLSNVTKYYYQ